MNAKVFVVLWIIGWLMLFGKINEDAEEDEVEIGLFEFGMSGFIMFLVSAFLCWLFS